MGHFYEVLTGKGKNRSEAFWDAWGDYQHENGTRCNLRSDYLGDRDPDPRSYSEDERVDAEPYGFGDEQPRCYGTLLRREPPLKWEETTVMTKNHYGYGYTRHTQMEQVPDRDVPESEWLEVWEFRVHYHA
jgi:hypothetical protein